MFQLLQKIFEANAFFIVRKLANLATIKFRFISMNSWDFLHTWSYQDLHCMIHQCELCLAVLPQIFIYIYIYIYIDIYIPKTNLFKFENATHDSKIACTVLYLDPWLTTSLGFFLMKLFKPVYPTQGRFQAWFLEPVLVPDIQLTGVLGICLLKLERDIYIYIFIYIQVPKISCGLIFARNLFLGLWSKFQGGHRMFDSDNDSHKYNILIV